MKRSIAIAVLALAVAGCGGDSGSERDNSGQRGAGGEVLGGTISDAMIPLESVRSQSPALRVVPVEQADEAESEEGAAPEEGGITSGPGSDAQPAAPGAPAA